MRRQIFLFIFAFFMLGSPLLLQAQEGTRQLMPNSTDRLWLQFLNNGTANQGFAAYGCPEVSRLNIYLKTGEKMHFGMNMRTADPAGNNTSPTATTFRVKAPDGTVVFAQQAIPTTGTGYIANYTEAIKGPNGVKVNGTTISGGYDAFTFTATQTGDHYIEFEAWTTPLFTATKGSNRQFRMEFFDVAVTDGSDNLITNPGSPNVSAGRLWSKQWTAITTEFDKFKVKADFYVFTGDEFVNKVTYNMYPNGFTLVANSFGASNTGSDVVKRQSTRLNSVSNNVPQYKIFLNDPDWTVYVNANIPPPVVKAWFEGVLLYDYDYNRNPQTAALTLGTVTVKKNGGAGCTTPSVATFKIESNIAGKATILLDLNGDGFKVGTVDRALYKDIYPGENFLTWDLKDANGALMADGTFSASATFVGRGPAHFPMTDVETLEKVTAFSIRPFNRLGPTLYWDDSQIDNPTGAQGTPNSTWGDETGGGGMDATQIRQFLINSTVPRIWTFNPSKDNNNDHYNGNLNTLNTWFNAIDLGIPNFNYQIITDNTVCRNGAVPILANISKSGEKNTDIPITSKDLAGSTISDFLTKYADPNGTALTKVKIISLPQGTEGTLKLGAATISVNQEINLVDLNNIVFVPANDWTGTTSFQWNATNGTNYSDNNATVTVTINNAPTITSIAAQNVCMDNATNDLSFTISDDLTAVNSLTVSASSSNLVLVPINNITFGGTGTNRTIKVTPVAGETGNANITVFVNDGTRSTNTTFTVVVGPSNKFTGDTRICANGTLSLVAEEVGATYTWTKPDNSTVTTQALTIASMSSADFGTYKLKVEKGSCTSEKTFTIEKFPSVAFTGNTNVCIGGNLVLTATEDVAIYEWKRDATVVGTGKVLNIPVVAGSYTLKVTKDGCNNTSTAFNVTEQPAPDKTLTINATATTICVGNSTTITIANSASSVSYQLRNGSTNIGSPVTGNGGTITLPTGTISSNTTFNVLATTSLGCSLEMNTKPTVTVINSPLIDLATQGSNVCVGNDGTVTIKGSQTGVSYQAYKGATSVGAFTSGTGSDINITIPSANLTTGANVITFVASNGGCTANLANSATINVGNPPSADRKVSGNLCVESGATAGVTIENSENGVSYQLRKDADNSLVGTAVAGNGSAITLLTPAVTEAASYNIFATGTAGCNQSTQLTQKVNVFPNNIALTVKADKDTTFFGETVNITATGGTTYTWKTRRVDNNQADDVTIVSNNNLGAIAVLPNNDTWYIVTASDANGCSRTDSVLIVLKSEIYIPSLFSPNGDGSNDVFKVTGRGIVEIDLKVFDRAGNLLYETNSVQEATTTGWNGIHNGQNQPIGMYIWAIEGKFFNGAPVKYEGKNQGKINLTR